MKFTILTSAMRTLVNMVPTHFDFDAESIKSEDYFESINILQPLEILEGHAYLELLLANPKKIMKHLDRDLLNKNFKPALIDLIITDPDKSLAYYAHYKAKPEEVYFNLSMKNPIQNCLEYEKP